MIQIKRSEDFDSNSPHRFAPGALVRHRRYDYRGLVVAVDSECMANEEWYNKNKTQPRRDQAWYHVLVHGTDMVTYAAQDSLTEEWELEAIEHPLVSVYFTAFLASYYTRNEKPWI